ncbi:MAG TPA: patatin-like phospholipase family protein [Mycobacteriales bacterium]|nr:patatin-like phospholipase family protein [Mycobacteriales bacterium]
MTETAESVAVSAVFGGGGHFGIAYGLGVVDTLVGAGLDLSEAPLLGTSAGSWVSACIATGVTIDQLADLPEVRVPDTRPGLLRDVAREVFADRMAPRVTVSAVRLPAMRREFLSGADFPLADLVAASSAVPGLFRPAQVGASSYVDGGVRSLVSADHAAPARNLLVIAPIAGPMFGPAGRTMELMLRRELSRWERRSGGTVHFVRPNTQIARLARTPRQLFDVQRAAAAYELALAQTASLINDRRWFEGLTASSSDAA